MKNVFFWAAAAVVLSACSYGSQRFSSRSPETLRANAQAVHEAERAERAERRAERRKEMMDKADAVNRATGGGASSSRIYVDF
ncbi:hypothetical protein [Neisseria sp.]|uniref:hypothetical protein n=1 Tax=Neisseria sp. TaxID=192066 RepID=UPI0026DD87A9|nr:hypothetical protein [Neisseria sp.]MDO4906377.1 hypothetical protein [Neisseria sp.]